MMGSVPMEYVIWILFLLASFLFFDYQNNHLTVNRIVFLSKRLPKQFDGFRIVHLSDLHEKTFGRSNQALLQKIASEKPNLIVITGDIVFGYCANIDRAIKCVEGFSNIAPTYFVSGNHEAKIKESRRQELYQRLQEQGVIVLNNKKVRLKKKEEEILLLGIDDPCFLEWSNRQEKFSKLLGVIVGAEPSECYQEEIAYTSNSAEAVSFEPSQGADTNINNPSVLQNAVYVDESRNDLSKMEKPFQILLSHRPERFSIYKRYNIDLTLAGHVHGGQIRLPYFGGVYSPEQGLFPKYQSGLYQEEEGALLVSRGLGKSIFPLRVFNYPELISVTLKKDL